MSFECTKATKGQSCSRCGRVFSSSELVFIDKDGDAICIELCFRNRPSKVTPFRRPVGKTRAARMSKPAPSHVVRTPVVEKETHSDLMTDILKEGIEEMARKLKEGEKP